MTDAATEARTAAWCITCGGAVYAEGLSTCGPHVADELGITYRQLDYWARRGYLRPGRRPARRSRAGTGVSRVWSPAELEIARRMARLTAAGIIPERAAVFARGLWPSGEIGPGIRIEAA